MKEISDPEDEIKRMPPDVLLKNTIGVIIILLIIILFYYIISFIIRYNRRNDPVETIRSDKNVLFLNEHLFNQAIDSKNVSNEYLKKYTIANSQDGYGNYNIITNALDKRKVFQTTDGNLYMNIN